MVAGQDPDGRGKGAQPFAPAPQPPQSSHQHWPAPPQVAPPQVAPPQVAPSGPYAPPPVAPSGPYAPDSIHAYAPARPPRRLAWPGVLALLLVLALAAVVVLQAVELNRVNDRLRAANDRIGHAQTADDDRLDTLEGKAAELERQVGKVFDPEAIAAAVLPSVFRVRAGDFTGTAFAVGRPATDGGTFLLTNFHVVEQLYDEGSREVFSERKDERYPATIVKVDREEDVAQLKTPHKFTGLTTTGAAVKSGQPIIVVGAPLGLTDSVTTGVVSAFRKLEDGTGPVIQFDAPINPGNSGGPVINSETQVVGIATWKRIDAEGIGLALPIDTACDLFDVC
jgi:S1-C subfamily serine protease